MEYGNSRPALSILIVEDDLAAGEIVSRMIAMKFSDAAVYSAPDGVVGEELFKKHTPEIVITDISMPNKNGIEMVREIKSLKVDTKFIVLTAHSDNIFLEQFKEIGFNAYLFKPLDLDQLSTAIEKCIAEIRQER